MLFINFKTLSQYSFFLSRHYHCISYLFPDTVTILLISFKTLSLHFLFLSRHCHFTSYFFPDTVTIFLIYFQTLSLYFLFLSRHCHYTSYFFPDTVTILLISFKTLSLYFLFIPDTVAILLISFQTLSLYFLFLPRHCRYTSYLTCHIIPPISAPILLIFHPCTLKQAALVARKHSKCTGRDVRLFTLSESRRYRQVWSRSVTSNILSQQLQRNGTETWRRRSFQCEQLRLVTHENILLNGDVPRRNGNVTYSVNRPLQYCLLYCY